MALLEVKNIYKSFGGVKAIQDFSIEANAGEIHGIISQTARAKQPFLTLYRAFTPQTAAALCLTAAISQKWSSIKSHASAWGARSRIYAFSKA